MAKPTAFTHFLWKGGGPEGRGWASKNTCLLIARSLELGACKLLPRDNNDIAKRDSPSDSYAKRAYLPSFSISSASRGANLPAPSSQLKAMGKQVRAPQQLSLSLPASRGRGLPAPSSQLKAMGKQVRVPRQLSLSLPASRGAGLQAPSSKLLAMRKQSNARGLPTTNYRPLNHQRQSVPKPPCIFPLPPS